MTKIATANRPWKVIDPTVALIDEWGHLHGEIAALEKREKELAAQIKALGAGDHAGSKCIAAITIADRETLDTKALRAVLPDELIAKFTKTATVVTLKLKALV